MKHLQTIEAGILLFIALFTPPFGKFLAILTFLILEGAKRAQPVQCNIKKDLTGKVAIITGGNTGIGKETALELARQGCEVVIGARDIKKNMETVEEIIKLTNNRQVVQISLDLGSKSSVDQFSQQIHSRFNAVHYLINNAGVMMIPERRTTVDGFEMQIGVNHLGHFYLTYKLWDLLSVVSDVRIVNVSAKAHKTFISPLILDFDNLNLQHGYSPLLAYQRSKLANVLFTQQLATRLSKTHPNARCVSLHPGVVRTELSRYIIEGKEWLKPIIIGITYLFMKSANGGAQTTLFATLADSKDLENGGYYHDSAITQKNPFAHNPENQKRLWKVSEELLKITFNAE